MAKSEHLPASLIYTGSLASAGRVSERLGFASPPKSSILDRCAHKRWPSYQPRSHACRVLAFSSLCVPYVRILSASAVHLDVENFVNGGLGVDKRASLIS